MENYPEMQFSEVVKDIPEASSIYINNIVSAKKRRGDIVTVLSLGEAFFEIPSFPFDEDEIGRGYHYSDSRGVPELRKCIAAYCKDCYDAVVDSDNEVLISAGSKPLIYMAFRVLLNPGDEVLIQEPAWLSYREEIKLAYGIPRFIPYDCSIEEYGKYCTEKTKVVVICNPNNPAGITYTKEDLLTLYKICRPKGIYILVDEAYSDFVSNGAFTSMASLVPEKDGIIVTNSLSKSLGISGWRLGYAISSPDVIFQLLKLNQHLITCPSTLLSLHVAKHFDELIRETTPQARALVEKRKAVTEYMHQIGLQCLKGSATFYIFMNIGDYGYSSVELSLYLLMRYGISIVPGVAYGQSTERFVRIAVGTESLEKIKESLLTIKKVIETNEYDKSIINRELSELHLSRFALSS